PSRYVNDGSMSWMSDANCSRFGSVVLRAAGNRAAMLDSNDAGAIEFVDGRMMLRNIAGSEIIREYSSPDGVNATFDDRYVANSGNADGDIGRFEADTSRCAAAAAVNSVATSFSGTNRSLDCDTASAAASSKTFGNSVNES